MAVNLQDHWTELIGRLPADERDTLSSILASDSPIQTAYLDYLRLNYLDAEILPQVAAPSCCLNDHPLPEIHSIKRWGRFILPDTYPH